MRQRKQTALTKESQRIVEYWRDSLVDGQRVIIGSQQIRNLKVEVSLDAVREGKFPASIVQALLEKKGSASNARGVSPAGEQRRNTTIEVAICPVRLMGDDQQRNRYLEVLWVPALLDPDGVLRVSRRGKPWIPRELLEPLIDDDSPVVGSIEAVSRFTEKVSEENAKTWPEYWKYCESFFAAVTGSRMQRFKLKGYTSISNGMVLPLATDYGSMQQLIEAFNHVLSGAREPSLLQRVATLSAPEPKSFSYSPRRLTASAQQHCAQFGDAFELAPSQRRSVHRFFETPPGDFLCVTGPPGTGKTTLLQSIVASLWVRAISGATAMPPVIVACGATNQSVMNVIDCFSKATSKHTALAERWLPSISSYGRFCCSASKAADVRNYQLELFDGTGLSSVTDRPEYIEEARSYFARRYKAWSGKDASPERALKHLEREIASRKGLLYRKLARLRDGSFSEWLRSGFGFFPHATYDEIFLELKTFDKEIRHELFLLATHYWEARWLVQAGTAFRRKEDGARRSRRFSNRPEDWQLRAMITPAFVSTLGMVPRFFGSKGQSTPMIDLLIFDEAGQIPPETGAACMLFAKRALIVGDDLQLEPMWGVLPHIDRSNAVRHRLLKSGDEDAWRRLSKKGLCASSGSLMRLALGASSRIDQSTKGVFLTEQRRSVPELVRFSNELAYRNRLEAKRLAVEPRVLPVFGYVHIEGKSEQVGPSRMNRFESRQLVQWLKDNENALKAFYKGTTITEIVAILSPFTAQARAIKNELGKEYRQMIVGTVHALQGAERPVVLFSSVYDRTFSGDYFFDRNRNMLNVAVSRAKDSFVVFGDMGIFDRRQKRPSGLLAKYLLADSENELAVAPARPHQSSSEDEFWPLTTLEEHRNLLKDALVDVQEELIIVSPTISEAALLDDGIPDLIRLAISRGVRVAVYTDYDLDREGETLKPRAVAGRKLIVEAGASLKIVDRIHNKAVLIDNYIFVDGSFNWLSANRNAGSRHQKYESSTVFRGPLSTSRIRKLKEELESRTRES